MSIIGADIKMDPAQFNQLNAQIYALKEYILEFKKESEEWRKESAEWRKVVENIGLIIKEKKLI